MPSNLKKAFAKIWKFLWKDDSLLSWIVNIILAFIIVKFLIYPGLGFMLQTTHPVVAVVSSSMEHNSNFDEWWNTQKQWYTSRGFSKEDIKKWHFSNGFNKGDIMILRGEKIQNIKIGDVIVFRGTSNDPIIHRVVKIRDNPITIETKGDNNQDSFPSLGETNIKEPNLIGKAVFRIPLVGWVKILSVETTKLIRG